MCFPGNFSKSLKNLFFIEYPRGDCFWSEEGFLLQNWKSIIFPATAKIPYFTFITVLFWWQHGWVGRTAITLEIQKTKLLMLHLRSSRPQVFLRKGVLKICRKFTGEHPYQSAISIKLFCNFLEIAFRRGFSPVNLVHFFRTPFPKNMSGWLLLSMAYRVWLVELSLALFSERS